MLLYNSATLSRTGRLNLLRGDDIIFALYQKKLKITNSLSVSGCFVYE